MTNAELDLKIEKAMSWLKNYNAVGFIKKAWREYSEDLREIALKKRNKGEKMSHAIERLSDMYPCENYCYICFDNDGNGSRAIVENNQYFQGNSGPVACVSLSPNITYKDIQHEIEETLSQAFDVED